jgi:PAS domain S-box-containing protein
MKTPNQFIHFKSKLTAGEPKQRAAFLKMLLLFTALFIFISYPFSGYLIRQQQTGFQYDLYPVLALILIFSLAFYIIKRMLSGPMLPQKQGAHILVNSYNGKLRNKTNDPVLFFYNNNDMKPVEKEHALSDVQLQQALERYDFISKATSDTIWDWDIPNDTILYNGGIHKMFGYTSKEVQEIRTWWMNNIHPEDIYHVNQMLEVAFSRARQNIELMYRYRGADGNYKYIFDRAFIVYNSEGKPVRMIGSMQDETRRYEEEKRITRAIIQAQERERQQLGMELHDNVNQILSAANLHLGLIPANSNADEDSVKTAKNVQAYINDAIQEIRQLSHQLAPASDKDVSLCELIRTLVKSFNVNGRFTVNYNAHFPDADRISKDMRVGLYRIIQEQLNNIVKHAHATSITVELIRQERHLHLRIKDNGVGFDAAVTANGIGFENINRRVKYLNGTLQISSQPQNGCEVQVTVPVTETADACF